jgi:2,5-diamino-6-(ribosylamino)-4(3H)-pyrimidinone 5'-phosphate reductase
VPIERLMDRTGVEMTPDDLYLDLRLPEPPPDRPYTAINMVSTADGKILIGPPGSTAHGLGSPTDQMLMRRIQGNMDGALIGAGTLRPGNVVYRPEMWRAVITRSGELPLDNRFFTDAPGKAIIFAPEALLPERRTQFETQAQVRIVGEEAVDVAEAARILRQEYGIHRLIVEGGAALNFEFVAAGLVDELFLSFTPKLKGGSHLPTVVDGPGLPDREWLPMEIISLYHDGDELYFRYRVGERKSG